MSPPTSVQHIPLSRAFARLANWTTRHGDYRMEAESEAETYLQVTPRGDGELKLEVVRPRHKHSMTFYWSDKNQDPHPVQVAMEFKPIVHAAVQESDNMYLVLLTSSGKVLNRFQLP